MAGLRIKCVRKIKEAKSLYIVLASLLCIPWAYAQSGEDEPSRSGQFAFYVSGGYQYVSRIYRSDIWDNTDRMPIGGHAEIGFGFRRKSYMLFSVNWNRKSQPVSVFLEDIDYPLEDYPFEDWTRVQNVLDVKAGFKRYWDFSSMPYVSLYMSAHLGIEFYATEQKGGLFDGDRETARELMASLAPGVYVKLHPSLWVDLGLGYKRIIDSVEEEYDFLEGTYHYPYFRIGVVYPFGSR